MLDEFRHQPYREENIFPIKEIRKEPDAVMIDRNDLQRLLLFLMDEYGYYHYTDPMSGEAYAPEARPHIEALLKMLYPKMEMKDETATT